MSGGYLRYPTVILITGLVLWNLGSVVAVADINSLTIPSSSQDGYIRQDQPTVNYGLSNTIRIESRNGNRNYRGLVQFDISPIPPGAVLEAADLRMYASTVPALSRTINVHRLNNSWLEGNGNGVVNSPAINGVTWWERQYGDNTWTGIGPWDWQNRGGDFQGTPTAGAATTSGWMSWSVLTDVAGWYGGSPNYGWLVRDAAENSPTRERTRFVSKEDGNPLLWPQLVVTYLMAGTQGPVELFVGQPTTVTVSFVNTGGVTGDQLSSATITIPAGYSDIPTSAFSYTIVATGGKNWQMVAGPTGQLGPQSFTIAAATPVDELAGGEQVDVTFTLRAPWLAGNTQWPSTIIGAAGGTFTPPPLDVMVAGTALSLVNGGDQSLLSVLLSGLDQTTNGILGTLTARDGRGAGDGWQVIVAATDFSKVGDPSKTISAAGLSVPSPPPVTTVSGSNPPTSSGGSLAGVGLQLLFAAAGEGLGEFQVTPDLALLVPAETFVGSYESTVTETISSLP